MLSREEVGPGQQARFDHLLLGLPVLTGGAHLDNPQKLQTTNWNLFVQDDWRVRPSVTLSAGLRYDYIGPPVDEDDRHSPLPHGIGGGYADDAGAEDHDIRFII